MKKGTSFLLVVLLAAILVGPTAAFGGPSTAEVQKNVENLWQPILASQPQITAVALKKSMDKGDKFVLLDVRKESEFEAAHLPGAINISRGVLEWVTPKMIADTDTKIYVYCRTGARAAFAVKRLTEMGYTDVTNFAESFKGWTAAGYPVYNQHGEFVMTQGGYEKKE